VEAKSSKRIAAGAVPIALETNAIQSRRHRVAPISMTTISGCLRLHNLDSGPMMPLSKPIRAHLDATLTVRDRELVLVPGGYHPVVAAHGYNVY
jgi:hypothetical protein